MANLAANDATSVSPISHMYRLPHIVGCLTIAYTIGDGIIGIHLADQVSSSMDIEAEAMITFTCD